MTGRIGHHQWDIRITQAATLDLLIVCEILQHSFASFANFHKAFLADQRFDPTYFLLSQDNILYSVPSTIRAASMAPHLFLGVSFLWLYEIRIQSSSADKQLTLMT